MDILVYYGTEEEKKAWNDRIVTISDASKLSQQQLEHLPDDAMIRIVAEGTTEFQQALYSKGKYGKIMGCINQRFGDIEPAIKGDKNSEMQTFLEVYKRLGQISYDEYAISSEGKSDELLQITCRNLEGGLLEDKCVCAGYAEILRNILAMKNMDAKFISGHNPNTKQRTCMEPS